VVAKDRETLVFASLLRRQQAQVLLPPLRPSNGNVCNCHTNTVTSNTPALNGSGDGLPRTYLDFVHRLVLTKHNDWPRV